MVVTTKMYHGMVKESEISQIGKVDLEMRKKVLVQ